MCTGNYKISLCALKLMIPLCSTSQNSTFALHATSSSHMHTYACTQPPTHRTHMAHILFFVLIFLFPNSIGYSYSIVVSQEYILIFWNVQLSEHNGFYFDAEVDHIIRKTHDSTAACGCRFLVCYVHDRSEVHIHF